MWGGGEIRNSNLSQTFYFFTQKDTGKRKSSEPPARVSKKQMTLKPKEATEEELDSEASTLIFGELDTIDMEGMDYEDTDIPVGMAEEDLEFPEVGPVEEQGMVLSDAESLSSIGSSDEEEEDPAIPINTGRWTGEEVEALFTAVNVNRDAIKFNFDGPGGGKEVRRQGWRDVVGKYPVYISYINI